MQQTQKSYELAKGKVHVEGRFRGEIPMVEPRSWNAVVAGFLQDEVIVEARVADGCVMLFFASGRQVSFAAKTKPVECKSCGETRKKPVVDVLLASPPATLFNP